jgi:hypothetical protein
LAKIYIDVKTENILTIAAKPLWCLVNYITTINNIMREIKMKEHPSVKTKILSDNNKFIISNISIKTSSSINVLRIFYNNIKMQQEIVKLFEIDGIKSSLEISTCSIVITDNLGSQNNILQALKVLREKAYISSHLADEGNQYYTAYLRDISAFESIVFNKRGLPSPILDYKNHHKVEKIKDNKDHEKVLEIYKKRIEKIIPVKPRYQYDDEKSINPAYTDIESSGHLCLDEKRIFVLRSDFILATGIKNVCVNEGNTDIFRKTDAVVHQYINKKDRYGHPSLTQVASSYDGSVYYAGWLCQRLNHIKVFLQSGRFHHSNLTDLEKMDIEFYIAYQFMRYYGAQDIIFYDCDENEKLTLFLADQLPKNKPHRIYKPSMLNTALSDEYNKKLLSYEEKMLRVKINLKHSLIELINDNEFKNAINSDCIDKIQNLIFDRGNNNSKDLCFDNIWRDIKSIFDLSMYHSYNNENGVIATNKFKEIIKIFIDAGIPFVDGKKIVIWSTRFARDEAVRFAEKNDAVTDGMAQKYLRKILLGWPDGKLNVFFELVKTPEPLFPAMSTVFWNAMSEIFISEMKAGDEVHLFFQDSITVGNFCWNIEFPIIRRNHGKILLHQYDTSTHSWVKPIDMDSPESANIYLCRRALHLFDLNNPLLNPSHVKTECGEKIWKQEFKDDDITKELVKWHTPKLVTLGKMKEIVKKWKSSCNNKNLFLSENSKQGTKNQTMHFTFFGYEMNNGVHSPFGLKIDGLTKKYSL